MSAAPEPLRILAVSLRYPPYVAGGYELMMRDVVEGLRGRGHRVSVLCAAGERFEASADLWPLLQPDLERSDDLFRWARESSNLERFRLHFLRPSNWRATCRALSATGAEVLFYFNLGLVSLAPLLAARHSGVPAVGYVCDPWLENHWVREWRENPESRQKAGGLALLERAWRGFRELAVGGTPVWLPSEYLAQAYRTDGLASDGFAVIPNALSPAMRRRAQARSEPPRREAGERLRVVCTSMHWHGKGIHVLLEACQLAVRAGLDLELGLAGAGAEPYAGELRRLCEAPELGGRVRFHGMLSADAVSALYFDAHVAVVPSLWGEPFGLATIEALAHGVPVVGSTAGATPELVRAGRDGILVPPGDAAALARALEALGRDEEQRLAFARHGRRRVLGEYDHDVLVERLEGGLRRVVERGAA